VGGSFTGTRNFPSSLKLSWNNRSAFSHPPELSQSLREIQSGMPIQGIPLFDSYRYPPVWLNMS
jgi:hypothetical protein